MRKLLAFFKKIVPNRLWQGIRRPYYAGLDLIRGLGPYVRQGRYCGFKLYYNRGNNIIRRLKKEPIFEREMCEAIVRELQKGRTGRSASSGSPMFLDIGANIGLVSAYVLSKVPNASIHAFEPGPAQRSLLQKTVAENRLENSLSIHAKALGKEIGERNLYVHDSKEMGKGSLADTGRGGAAKEVKVRLSTLDEWWKANGQPTVNAVKIDTEGAELWVLEGGAEFLKACKPVVFLEIEPQNLRVYPYDHFDILDFLHTLGYSLFTLDGRQVSKENFSSFIKEGKDTYVARPN